MPDHPYTTTPTLPPLSTSVEHGGGPDRGGVVASAQTIPPDLRAAVGLAAWAWSELCWHDESLAAFASCLVERERIALDTAHREVEWWHGRALALYEVVEGYRRRDQQAGRQSPRAEYTRTQAEAKRKRAMTGKKRTGGIDHAGGLLDAVID